MKKFYFLGLVLVWLGVFWSIGGFTDSPEVWFENGTRKPVACKALGTRWQLEPISHPACQEALTGPHIIVWVAPR